MQNALHGQFSTGGCLDSSMSNSELKTVSIDSLVFLRRNPQYLTPHEMKALKASIERDGFLSPILVRPLPEGKHEVVSGNHRAMAAKELGHREIASGRRDGRQPGAACRGESQYRSRRPDRRASGAVSRRDERRCFGKRS